ncbi:hypothetical protein MSAN_01521600 [Mycena sanguinolenta]|uniref:Protein kinase domain-containing protein n=1 Tax=Mycena sanguinolenta TaxID=230812 RepID=A0A8H7CWQ3_9AGAR|nr:hypothetical protein MSAN_01521600 [Mycena sanguinolenta]
MNLQSHPQAESALVSTTNATESTRYVGAFFPQAAGFSIRGGVFTSNTINHVYNSPPEQSSGMVVYEYVVIHITHDDETEFQTIRLGDIKLIKELKTIRLDHQFAIVGRERQGTSVRRIYSAEIRYNPGPVTVAIYQGDRAEEEWHQDLAKYAEIRHPNIMQLYGLVRTKKLCAMVFHDGWNHKSNFSAGFNIRPS